jgi:hypothetical protein
MAESSLDLGAVICPWACRNPITGIAAGCARAASGHVAAAPSVAKNFRRSMWLAM